MQHTLFRSKDFLCYFALHEHGFLLAWIGVIHLWFQLLKRRYQTCIYTLESGRVDIVISIERTCSK